MTNIRGLLCALVPVFALSVPVLAQTYTAKEIQFNTRGEFTQQQLEDAAGIHPGTKFTAADLGIAAQHLVNTGYFADVGATIDGKIVAATVKFDVKYIPNSQLLRVGFENFIWLSHAEIVTAIHEKFAMFNGFLADNSPHGDEVKDALTAALAAKSITARVEYETFEPTLRHPIREIAYRVEKPEVRVGNIKLTGATPAVVPLLQKSVNQTAHSMYMEGPADETTAERVLAPLLDAGYIKAALTDVSLEPTTTKDGVSLVLSAQLQAGEIYRVTGVTFAGTPVYSTEAFAAALKLHAGDVASRAALHETLKPMDTAYRRLGYMDVTITPVPTVDEAAKTVAYSVSVDPGEQYRVKDVTPNGLDPVGLAAFDRDWLMKAGELYNPDYIGSFLTKNKLNGYTGNFKAYADPGSHTVEVILMFYRQVR